MYYLALLLAICGWVSLGNCSNEFPPSDSRNLSCGAYETQCALGCCPYYNAVCCADGYECCPSGTTCIPIIGICIGLDTDGEDHKLTSDPAKKLRNLNPGCPRGTTTCGEKCCPLPNAVCCPDGEHCCPHGYICDIRARACRPDSSAMSFFHLALGNFISEFTRQTQVPVVRKTDD